jgi:hypothetical protein
MNGSIILVTDVSAWRIIFNLTCCGVVWCNCKYIRCFLEDCFLLDIWLWKLVDVKDLPNSNGDSPAWRNILKLRNVNMEDSVVCFIYCIKKCLKCEWQLLNLYILQDDWITVISLVPVCLYCNWAQRSTLKQRISVIIYACYNNYAAEYCIASRIYPHITRICSCMYLHCTCTHHQIVCTYYISSCKILK